MKIGPGTVLYDVIRQRTTDGRTYYDHVALFTDSDNAQRLINDRADPFHYFIVPRALDEVPPQKAS